MQKMRNIIHQTKDKKKITIIRNNAKNVAQSLYTRALDHFISFLAVKDRIISYNRFRRILTIRNNSTLCMSVY